MTMTEVTTEVRIYSVVDVWRGMAVGVSNFRRLKDAQRYLQRLRRHRNLDEDDVQLFESAVAFPARQGRTVSSRR